MSMLRPLRTLALATWLTLTWSAGASAQMVGDAQGSDADDWQFTLAPLYIWFAGLDGNASIGPVTAPVRLTFGDVLDNLDGIFTIHFEARKRRWTILADALHLQMKPGTTLGNGTAVSVTVRNDIGELGGAYRVRVANPTVDVLGGVRYTDLGLTGNNRGLIDLSESWWDGFGGARVRYAFGEKRNWSVSARGDVGTGGSDLTWSAYALVNWHFARSVTVTAGYKALAYDYTTGSGASRFDWNVTYQGPIAGFVFNW